MGKPLKVVNSKFGLVPEHLSEASPSRPACAECSLHESCAEPFIKPYVPENWTGKYLLVTETSKDGELGYRRNGLPIGERERVQLKALLKQSDIAREDVAVVPVLRCRPILTGAKKPKMTNLRACRPFLIRAINELNPDRLVAFGDSAVKSLMNTGAPGPVSLLRGRKLSIPHAEEQQVVFRAFEATSKLSSLLTDPHSISRVAEDLRRIGLPLTPYPAKGLPSGKEKEIGFDTEYSGSKVLTLGIADSQRGISVSPTNLTAIATRLASSTLVGHNLSVDIESLLRLKPTNRELRKALETWLQGLKQRDTLLEARLADENRGKNGYKLESLAVSYYNIEDWKKPTEDLGPDSATWPPLLRDERCRLDAWATLKIHKAVLPHVEGPSRLSHAIATSLRRMYWTGVYIDPTKFKKFCALVKTEREIAFHKLKKHVKKFGIDTENFTAKDAQLREYVYDGVGLEVENYTKGGLPSVSVKHLKEYKAKPEIEALLTFSKWDKLDSTYAESLATKFTKTRAGLWMPVQINPLAAKTGRRASSSPNMQNWPVSVRQIIISRFKGGTIADNDYSKLEPILGGWVANEPRLTEYFVKYPNGYIKIGVDFFKKTVEKNTKEYTMMKACVLAVIYKKMKWSLAEDIWSQGVKLASNYEQHIEETGKILERFLDMFPGIRRYHRQQEEEVLREGKVYNALGQCRRLPLPPEPPRGEKGIYRAWMKHKSHVINQAVNYPIQSLAAYVTGCALIDMERAFLSQWKYSYLDFQTALMEKQWPHMPLLCCEVHDDLVQDIPKGLEKKTKEITHDVMRKPPSLFEVLPELWDSNVKLSVDTNAGPCWGVKK